MVDGTEIRSVNAVAVSDAFEDYPVGSSYARQASPTALGQRLTLNSTPLFQVPGPGPSREADLGSGLAKRPPSRCQQRIDPAEHGSLVSYWVRCAWTERPQNSLIGCFSQAQITRPRPQSVSPDAAVHVKIPSPIHSWGSDAVPAAWNRPEDAFLMTLNPVDGTYTGYQKQIRSPGRGG